ncbi:MAG TPA: glycosyltransferase [Segetibacter sp.]|jgi:glycosyltransferase involved in cell wall biosynthesis
MIDHLPLVTIVAACFNHKDYVLQTLDSMRSQTYPNLQFIITDDGSKDGSKEIIQNWIDETGTDILFLNHPVNQGVCKNMNSSLPHVKGEYVKFISCDDVLLEGAIRLMVTTFLSLPPDYGIIYSDMFRINQAGEIDDKGGQVVKRKVFPIKGSAYMEMIERPFVTAPSAIVKKIVLDELNGFDESLVYEDHDFYLRASKKFKFHFLPEKTVMYRILSTSLINSSSGITYHKNQFYVYLNNYDKREPFRKIFKKRLLFCIKNLYKHKYKYSLFLFAKALLLTREKSYIKYVAASVPLIFTGKK